MVDFVFQGRVGSQSLQDLRMLVGDHHHAGPGRGPQRGQHPDRLDGRQGEWPGHRTGGRAARGGEGDDADEDKPDTKIVAEGLIFPILCHEIIKGIKAANARHGLPKDAGMRQKVKAQVDIQIGRAHV